MNDPIRGKAVDETTIRDNSGEDHKVEIPSDMIGKEVVSRDGNVQERIDS